MTIDEAELRQDEFNAVLGVLSIYTSRDQKYIEAKNKRLDNAKNLTSGEKKLLKALKWNITAFFKRWYKN